MGNGKIFINRELSWLEFDARVLGEAKDASNPLFERLKFLSITASNLDEFFMVRVASLKDMVNAGYTKKDIAGMSAKEQLEALDIRTHDFVKKQYEIYNDELVPSLAGEGFHIIGSHEELTQEQISFVDKYFHEDVYPVLTPMAVDSSRPFPLIRNKTLNIAALLKKKDSDDEETEFATVQVPSVLPRFVKLPGEQDTIILLEEIIERNIDKLFLNYDILCAYPYRIMRNADFSIDEEDAADLLKEIEKQLRKRQWGQAIRLEVQGDINKKLLKRLKSELNITDSDIYRIDGPLDLTFLMKLYGSFDYGKLKTPKYIPAPVPEFMNGRNVFDAIREGDILLHHPYQTFDPVVDFVKQAARDKDVLAIKQTLYRVSGNSPIVAALAEAAENGKQVSVLVELKARFDEENNIIWAKKLEQAGCHVIYGLVGLKTHSKITLVVRREEDGIRRYVHLGTGNYNDSTAKLYCDMGLFTCSPAIGEDAAAVFNMLSGYSEPVGWNKLSLAPLWLRDRFHYLVDREIRHAREGQEAHIIAKMNSVCDKDIIELMYKASREGVKVELIVRGICCLIPQLEGVSENITVRSIVGTFLEHSRIFYFENGGESEIYMASADWMTRNLDKRVEIMFPVEDARLKREVRHILDVQLEDNVKAQMMQPDGSYVKVREQLEKKYAGKPDRSYARVEAQMVFCKEAQDRAKAVNADNDVHNSRVFIPMKSE